MILQQLNQILLDRWDEFMPGDKQPERIDYLGIPGSIEGGTTTFLGLSPGRQSPLFAVKIHRNPDERQRAESEAEVLREIGTKRGAVVSTVPRLILCEEMGGSWVLVQSMLEGNPMTAPMTSTGAPKQAPADSNLSRASEWLIALYEYETEHLLSPSRSEDPASVRRILDFGETFPLTAEEKKFVKGLSDDIPRLKTTRSGIQHGDFCRQNILCPSKSGSGLFHVIDWTDSRLNGMPVFDFFFFVSSYCLQVRKKIGVDGFLETFNNTFFESNPYQKMIRERVHGHCLHLGIDREELDTLFAWFLVEQAMFEYGKLLKFAERGELPRFTLYLAASQGKECREALTEQLWIYFFKHFVKRKSRFLAAS